jgi:hypothetical protein
MIRLRKRNLEANPCETPGPVRDGRCRAEAVRQAAFDTAIRAGGRAIR